MRRLTAVAWIAVLAFAVGAPVLGAQGATFRGKVLTDSTGKPGPAWRLGLVPATNI